MPQPSYTYGVARVRVLETKLLGRDRIERMADAPSAEDVLKILAETSYAPVVVHLAPRRFIRRAMLCCICPSIAPSRFAPGELITPPQFS
jgi:vacuolar-type H+-ATPase subunit C/Vma6